VPTINIGDAINAKHEIHTMVVKFKLILDKLKLQILTVYAPS